MKKRGPTGESRSRKRKILPLIAGLLTAAMAVAVVRTPDITAKAAPIDLTRKCSLTVAPSAKPEILDDLLGSGADDNEMAVELYKVADAAEVSGYDTYDYELTEPYRASDVLRDALTHEVLSSEDMTNDKWQNELAQEAARIAFSDGVKMDLSQQYLVGTGIKIEDLDAGLYLVVVRDANPETGSRVSDEDAQDGETGDAQETPAITTKIYTERYEYAFAPQLVSLPGKELLDGDGNVVGNNTANPGDWQYDGNAVLKPVRTERFGSLEITKSLLSYRTEEPAQFVFRVNAYRDDDGDGTEELIYSNVVGITFDEPGQQKVTLADQIPVGARVVVTEEYSGAAYSVVGDAQQTLDGLISADEVLGTEFTNTYDEHNRKGHGIENSFTFSASDGWHWDQEPSAAE